MIDIAIFDENNLSMQGISILVAQNPDFRVVFSCHDRSILCKKLKNIKVNILLYNLHENSARNLNLIAQIKIINPKVRILVMSVIDDEDVILKTLKTGANGFLGKDSMPGDLTEAIYTSRGGHDYFSKSITHMVLNRYISGIKNDGSSEKTEINQLSTRQVEILKLMGESLSNQEIAERLYISVRTVETHKNHIMQKLNLKSTVDMIKFGIKNNIIDI
jgi:DNA-binding NarL/FixJ family response regulator